LKIFCPYCTKEINQGTLQCPFCGTQYQSETIQLLTEFVKVVATDDFSDRRRFYRIPKKFKIVYSTPKAFIEHYLTNFCAGGVFIQTDSPLKLGARLNLKIILPDGQEELAVLCEVIWCRIQGSGTAEERETPGMGVKFLDLTPEGKKRIDDICRKGNEEIDRILGRKK